MQFRLGLLPLTLAFAATVAFAAPPSSVATYECIGLYWKTPAALECAVRGTLDDITKFRGRLEGALGERQFLSLGHACEPASSPAPSPAHARRADPLLSSLQENRRG